MFLSRILNQRKMMKKTKIRKTKTRKTRRTKIRTRIKRIKTKTKKRKKTKRKMKRRKKRRSKNQILLLSDLQCDKMSSSLCHHNFVIDISQPEAPCWTPVPMSHKRLPDMK